MNNTIQNEILSATDILIKERLKELTYNSMVVCTVTKIDNNNSTLYQVQYDNIEFQACSLNDAKYSVGQKVCVNITQGENSDNFLNYIIGSYTSSEPIKEDYMVPLDGMVVDYKVELYNETGTVGGIKIPTFDYEKNSYDYLVVSCKLNTSSIEITDKKSFQIAITFWDDQGTNQLFEIKIKDQDFYGNPFNLSSSLNYQFKFDDLLVINTLFKENQEIPIGINLISNHVNVELTNITLYFGYNKEKIEKENQLFLYTNGDLEYRDDLSRNFYWEYYEYNENSDEIIIHNQLYNPLSDFSKFKLAQFEQGYQGSTDTASIEKYMGTYWKPLEINITSHEIENINLNSGAYTDSYKIIYYNEETINSGEESIIETIYFESSSLTFVNKGITLENVTIGSGDSIYFTLDPGDNGIYNYYGLDGNIIDTSYSMKQRNIIASLYDGLEINKENIRSITWNFPDGNTMLINDELEEVKSLLTSFQNFLYKIIQNYNISDKTTLSELEDMTFDLEEEKHPAVTIKEYCKKIQNTNFYKGWNTRFGPTLLVFIISSIADNAGGNYTLSQIQDQALTNLIAKNSSLTYTIYDDEIKEQFEQFKTAQYRIKNVYLPGASNNSIHCEIELKNKDIRRGTVIFQFGEAYVNGSQYSLNIDFVDQPYVLRKANASTEIQATFQRLDGQQINCPDIVWDWRNIENRFSNNDYVKETIRSELADISYLYTSYIWYGINEHPEIEGYNWWNYDYSQSVAARNKCKELINTYGAYLPKETLIAVNRFYEIISNEQNYDRNYCSDIIYPQAHVIFNAVKQSRWDDSVHALYIPSWTNIYNEFNNNYNFPENLEIEEFYDYPYGADYKFTEYDINQPIKDIAYYYLNLCWQYWNNNDFFGDMSWASPNFPGKDEIPSAFNIQTRFEHWKINIRKCFFDTTVEGNYKSPEWQAIQDFEYAIYYLDLNGEPIDENEYYNHITTNIYYRAQIISAIFNQKRDAIKNYDINNSLIWEKFSDFLRSDINNFSNNNDTENNVNNGIKILTDEKVKIILDDAIDISNTLKGKSNFSTLQATIKDYIIDNGNKINLTAYLSIPLVSEEAINNDIKFLSGPTRIVYDSLGKTASYSKDAFNLFKSDNTKLLNTDFSWELIAQSNNKFYSSKAFWNGTDWNINYYYFKTDFNEDQIDIAKTYSKLEVPQFKIYENEIYLRPLDYIPQEKTIVSLVISKNDEVYWAQPIITLQDNWGYELINNWSGTFNIDEQNGSILSSLIVAGTKNKNNEFTGVMLGDIAITGKPTASGLYGFQDGAARFYFTENGEAYIGTGSSNYFHINKEQNSSLDIKTTSFKLITDTVVIDSSEPVIKVLKENNYTDDLMTTRVRIGKLLPVNQDIMGIDIYQGSLWMFPCSANDVNDATKELDIVAAQQKREEMASLYFKTEEVNNESQINMYINSKINTKQPFYYSNSSSNGHCAESKGIINFTTNYNYLTQEYASSIYCPGALVYSLNEGTEFTSSVYNTTWKVNTAFDIFLLGMATSSSIERLQSKLYFNIETFDLPMYIKSTLVNNFSVTSDEPSSDSPISKIVLSVQEKNGNYINTFEEIRMQTNGINLAHYIDGDLTTQSSIFITDNYIQFRVPGKIIYFTKDGWTETRP